MRTTRVVWLSLVLLLAAWVPGARSGQIFKCVVAGKTIFQDKPCHGGVMVEAPPPANPEDVRAAELRNYQTHMQVMEAEQREGEEKLRESRMRLNEAILQRQEAATANQKLLRQNRCKQILDDISRIRSTPYRDGNSHRRQLQLKDEEYRRSCP
ncbi:MAG: hypothetical protein PHR30_12945 [Gallionellaceae bacterium]|nr:hypothetical protein [Gallionellaceae bacterium]